MSGIAVVWDPVFLTHATDVGHPENPRRLVPLYRQLADSGGNGHFTTIPPVMADEAAILRVHSAAYLAKVKRTALQPSSALSADTLTCAHSYMAAALAAGGTIEAIRRVADGTFSQVMVLARPPGHHAERNRAMGYCIFNTVAIGAMAARVEMGLSRILVVDWDLHHGNGTQHLFERDPAVYFFSSHQYPLYPGTGHFSETGLGPGEGTTMNVPLGKGFGDAEFAALYRRLLIPVARGFRPELILVSAGFDIHRDDPLGGMRVTPAGFAALARLIVDLGRECCGGRVVFCLEGGYQADALTASVMAMIAELTGLTTTDVVALAIRADPGRVAPVVDRCRQIHQRFFPSLGNPMDR